MDNDPDTKWRIVKNVAVLVVILAIAITVYILLKPNEKGISPISTVIVPPPESGSILKWKKNNNCYEYENPPKTLSTFSLQTNDLLKTNQWLLSFQITPSKLFNNMKPTLCVFNHPYGAVLSLNSNGSVTFKTHRDDVYYQTDITSAPQLINFETLNEIDITADGNIVINDIVALTIGYSIKINSFQNRSNMNYNDLIICPLK